MAGPRRLTELGAALREMARPHLDPGPVAIGLSGGADSAALAWVLVQLADDVGMELRAVHVDHRWPASPRLRHAASAIAGRLGLSFDVVEIEVEARTETAAREARAAALDATLRPGERVALGHTADDQVETIVGNIVRGAGIHGLAGMPRRRGRLVRPLLDARRAELRELATLAGLPWIDDPTNEDPDVRRVVIRRELLPFVESRLSRRVDEAVLRLGRHAAASAAEIERMADGVPLAVDRHGPLAEARMPWTMLVVVPDPVRAEVVRRAVRSVRPPYPPSDDEVARIVAVAEGRARRAELREGLVVFREGPTLVVVGREDNEPPPLSWSVPGLARWGSFAFDGWIDEVAPTAYPFGHWTEVFDADEVGHELTVRTVRPGDAVAMVGGHKDAVQALTEAGVAGPTRRRWPAVVDPEGVVLWLPGVRRAATGWVSRRTRRYLWLHATRHRRGGNGSGSSTEDGT